MAPPDAIVVLSSGIKQVGSRWASTDLTEEDNKQGAPGGLLRVFVTAILSNQYPSARVVATGGKGFDVPKDAPENRPLLCEILERELIEAGVPKERIELEEVSNNTYQQLQQLELLTRDREWTTVMIVSSRWHLPRIEAMLEIKFSKLKKLVQLVSAEEVLIENDPARWETTIADAYASEWLAGRIEKENQGIAQLKNGTYQFI